MSHSQADSESSYHGMSPRTYEIPTNRQDGLSIENESMGSVDIVPVDYKYATFGPNEEMVK